jgi:NADH-quinone oxidoreductase subunit G
MMPAADGTRISIEDSDAKAFRAGVIEWLMVNHPHDCPVCDEGGECLLQDYTVAGGHGIRRYQGKKRTFLNQFLGPYIEHEMNRCIECYRCVRFYQEVAGGSDFGVMGSAARVYFGRFQEGRLESPFSGNLVDICPTGVFTDKTARFRARYWDYEMAPSVCPWCSLGCNTVPAARYRELLKTMARRNDAVNGWFICDRGRFTNAPVNDPARPRVPLVDGKETSWDAAFDALALRIEELAGVYGPGGVALVGSSRLSLEGQLVLARLVRVLDGASLCYFAEESEAAVTRAAVERLTAENSASMGEVAAADLVVLAETDPMEEGPMMALAVRQAWRKGARIFAVGATPAQRLAADLSIEVTTAVSLAEVPLAEAKRPVVVCGTAHRDPALVAGAAKAGARLAYLLSGPNACGAAMLAREYGAVSLEAALATGKVKGIVAVEADIPEALLGKIPFVAACDWLPTDAARRADVLLPTAAWVEADGTFVNNEGRAQRFRRAMIPGLPIKGLPARYHASPDKPAPFHPPRVHRGVPPGGYLRPAWRIVADLIERLGGERVEELFEGRWETLRELDPEGEGGGFQFPPFVKGGEGGFSILRN